MTLTTWYTTRLMASLSPSRMVAWYIVPLSCQLTLLTRDTFPDVQRLRGEPIRAGIRLYPSLWIAGPVKGSGDQFHQVRELVLPIG